MKILLLLEGLILFCLQDNVDVLQIQKVKVNLRNLIWRILGDSFVRFFPSYIDGIKWHKITAISM